MLCIVCFDLWVLIRSLKSTKRPASKFSKMVRDLLDHRPTDHSIDYLDYVPGIGNGIT